MQIIGVRLNIHADFLYFRSGFRILENIGIYSTVGGNNNRICNVDDPFVDIEKHFVIKRIRGFSVKNRTVFKILFVFFDGKTEKTVLTLIKVGIRTGIKCKYSVFRERFFDI